jgi:uncharacterized protein
MSFSMSQASLPVFEISLNALSAVLEKAEAHAATKGIDSSVLLNSRLYPDMFALVSQVQVATDQAKNGSARLAGVEPPRYEDNETTMDQLKARLAKTVAYLKTLDPRRIDASADREITFPLGPKNTGQMKGHDYLNHAFPRAPPGVSSAGWPTNITVPCQRPFSATGAWAVPIQAAIWTADWCR